MDTYIEDLFSMKLLEEKPPIPEFKSPHHKQLAREIEALIDENLPNPLFDVISNLLSKAHSGRKISAKRAKGILAGEICIGTIPKEIYKDNPRRRYTRLRLDYNGNKMYLSDVISVIDD